ncbi:phosphonate C-P lyase system protein PhnG [Stappia sp. ES.058]|uniref:phosphonate C-P lyase system protein PhnG n=1 Tax=Stappia sp. ES.058 TaxID=1881061 RepID=UPI00087BDCF8|nr:phosphonate C-P lyase system protein PhnG [Stappia sp. ES.058]SDU31087.1 alpha-D-ribose 1-methylphosphonate 5-triphosphate synthase subunit PhnG [Stappia sp. ES.058]
MTSQANGHATAADPQGDEAHGLKTLMDVLAASPAGEIAACAEALGPLPEAAPVRGPETGLVMVRGRIGGDGAPFNLGEATVTRATVRLEGGAIGHAYALGQNRAKARLSATLAALWTQGGSRAEIDAAITAPLLAARAREATQTKREAAATKVDFFTMVRGDD